jgi:hypothetical protein
MPAVPWALRGLTSVFGMGTGGPSCNEHQGNSLSNHIRLCDPSTGRASWACHWPVVAPVFVFEIYFRASFPAPVAGAGGTGSTKEKKEASRPISIARLHPSRGLHLRPIDVVVYHGSFGGIYPTGNLFLGWVSRLDAFSVYPLRTWLLRAAPGGTTDTPVVRPTRSSRTRVRFLQISNAHIG